MRLCKAVNMPSEPAELESAIDLAGRSGIASDPGFATGKHTPSLSIAQIGHVLREISL
jgi:hypothetical protein